MEIAGYGILYNVRILRFRFQEVCNMVAKAAIDRRGGGILTLRTAANPVDPRVYEPWEMTPRERELTSKCIKLIQGRISTKVICYSPFFRVWGYFFVQNSRLHFRFCRTYVNKMTHLQSTKLMI